MKLETVKKSAVSFFNDNYITICFFFLCLIFLHTNYFTSADTVALKNIFLATYGEESAANITRYLIDKTTYDALYWSSRVIINFFSNLMLFFPGLWLILDAIFCTLQGYSIIRLFDMKDYDLQVAALLSTLLFGHDVIYSSGWLIGTVTYYWPLCFTLIGANILIKERYKNNILNSITLILCMIYAANEELICISLLFILPALAWYKRDIRKMAVTLDIIDIIELLWFLFCPGNRARSANEVQSWFPGFDNLDVIQKMQLGFSATFTKSWLAFSAVILALSFTLLMLAVRRKREPIAIVVCGLPFLMSLYGCIGHLHTGLFRIIFGESEFLSESGVGIISAANYGSLRSYLPIVFIIVGAGSLLISVLHCFDYSKESVVAAISLTSVAAARCAMGFSPTVWASGERTFTFMWGIEILVFVWCLNKLAANGKETEYKLSYLLTLALILYKFNSYIIAIVNEANKW